MKFLDKILAPVSAAFQKRTERKMAQDTAKAKLQLAKQDANYQLDLKDAEWEALATGGMGDTWKDEYVTVSVVSIINLYVLAGILSAFGLHQPIEGMSMAMLSLLELGVDVGFLMTAVVLSAVGLKVWRSM